MTFNVVHTGVLRLCMWSLVYTSDLQCWDVVFSVHTLSRVMFDCGCHGDQCKKLWTYANHPLDPQHTCTCTCTTRLSPLPHSHAVVLGQSHSSDGYLREHTHTVPRLEPRGALNNICPQIHGGLEVPPPLPRVISHDGDPVVLYGGGA